MRNGYADRLGEDADARKAEREERQRFSAPGPWLILEESGRRYRVLAAELWDKEPKVFRVDDEGKEHRVAECRRVVVVEALRNKEIDERRRLENEQTDARAIAWLKERGLLVESLGGQWVLKETP